MNMYPSLEARVTVQERRQIDLEGRMEDFAEDMKASHKQLSEHLGKIEDQLIKTDVRLDKIESRLDKMDERFDKVEGRLDKMETNITSIKSTMAKNHQDTVQVLTQILEHLP